MHAELKMCLSTEIVSQWSWSKAGKHSRLCVQLKPEDLSVRVFTVCGRFYPLFINKIHLSYLVRANFYLFVCLFDVERVHYSASVS